jgi:glycerol transport system ATP-binding protein
VQFGETSTIYRQPHSLEGARVFSDPPINTAAIEKRGDSAYLSDSVSWKVPAQLAAMPDGRYTIGLRPHHLLPGGDGVAVDGEVQISEISGSESIVRINIEGNNWVSEAHGIHSYKFGARSRFFFDSSRCLYFDANQQRIGTGP